MIASSHIAVAWVPGSPALTARAAASSAAACASTQRGAGSLAACVQTQRGASFKQMRCLHWLGELIDLLEAGRRDRDSKLILASRLSGRRGSLEHRQVAGAD